MADKFDHLRRDPALWMFLAGLSCFMILFYGLSVRDAAAMWLQLGIIMICLIGIFHEQARRHELKSSKLYGVYRRLAGFAMAWPAGWLIVLILSVIML